MRENREMMWMEEVKRRRKVLKDENKKESRNKRGM